MRIGLIAPPWIPVPPTTYGGTEAVVADLARGLMARGHDVVLFTVGESASPVTVRSLYPVAVEPMGADAPEAAHVLAAYDALSDVDVIHDHTLLGSLVAARHAPGTPPVVCTNHNPFTPENVRIFHEIARNAAVVAISHAHARSAAGVPIAAVIHHGVDVDVYRPDAGTGDFLVFVGRMSPDKGVHRAVRVAQEAGRELVVVTRISEPAEHAYYQQVVRPMLSAGTEVLTDEPFPRRLRLLQHADALLNPIAWPEPFGLVMAEALACATPVLAFPCGAAPEIVEHGRTGFLCRGIDDMIARLDDVAGLDRADCRRSARERFSLERMAAAHERLYEAVLRGYGVHRRSAGARR
ncbi:glycosyltransferase family 4 protein [Lentzea sp. HUAS12]|uniref:glycosyltransferase family 4 protein n=1 Tax=Lentzea sp. HUAS12 TaxID=2951806 RepID=UPI0020A1552F|nr:glycosyltransferase family 4 protein [Lentzea sp. HUAS12]USX54383.1 glycosyltransferase family 4 protein [Lentzea sp. HUAS12]